MPTRFLDSLITYRILRLLTTPFVETEAYRLGIIDAKGKELKKMSQLNTVAERDAYTLLHRLVFRIKKIVEKVPIENKKFLSFAAALALVKEQIELNKEPMDLELRYLNKLKDNLSEELKLVEEFQTSFKIKSFKYFIEDAPVNNAAATPGIAGFTPETLGVRKKRPVLTRFGVKNVKKSS